MRSTQERRTSARRRPADGPRDASRHQQGTLVPRACGNSANLTWRATRLSFLLSRFHLFPPSPRSSTSTLHFNWRAPRAIVQVLTQQPDFQVARKYWNKLKERLGKEGSQLVTNCHRLKLPAGDGKMRLTDVANAETLLRLVQSVPSPKTEPIKLWLAKVLLKDFGLPWDSPVAYWTHENKKAKSFVRLPTAA